MNGLRAPRLFALTCLLGLLAARPALAAPFVASDPTTGTHLELERSGAGEVRGRLRYQGMTYPVAGRIQEGPGGFAVSGVVFAEGERIPFAAQRQGGFVFVEGDGEQARLRVEREGSLGGRARHTGQPRRNRPRTERAPPAEGRDQAGRARAAPRMGRTRAFSIRDRAIGGAVAYTWQVPVNWKAEGEIVWGGGKVKFPEQKLKLESPEGIVLEYLPRLMAPAHMPPPRDVGAWLAQMMERASPEVSNARVVEQIRDHEAEAQDRAAVGNIGTTHHKILLTFEKNGQPYKTEVAVGFQNLPVPTLGGPQLYNWNLSFKYVASFPVALYTSARPLASRIFSSVRVNKRWEQAAQQNIRRQQGQARVDNQVVMNNIIQNGRRISETSDIIHEGYMNRQAIKDRAHERTVDSIHDRTAYRRPGGGRVKLPSQYDYAYETPQGDYVVSEQRIDDADLSQLEED